jgi:hypothetical protein
MQKGEASLLHFTWARGETLHLRVLFDGRSIGLDIMNGPSNYIARHHTLAANYTDGLRHSVFMSYTVGRLYFAVLFQLNN